MKFLFFFVGLIIPCYAQESSFTAFDQAAKKGERLTVAFFGASLTWGACASDQARTSYRARIADKLQEKYPEAHFTFIDGAIGGTRSNLGAFRLQRDCLKHKPNLVFLDFSANDNIYSDAPETLAAYESLVRRIITEGKAALVQVIFPFPWDYEPGRTLKKMKGRTAHLKIADAYQVPVGDAVFHIKTLVDRDKSHIEKIWEYYQDVGTGHPGDYGYRIFAEAAWDGFMKGISENMRCTAPEKMLNENTYMNWSRNRISQLNTLPKGWEVTYPSLTSAWYDAYMPRWLDDVVAAKNMNVKKEKKAKNTTKTKLPVEPLIVKFKAKSVFIFGEETITSGKYEAFVDGKPCTWGRKKNTEFNLNSKRCGGTRQHFQTLITGLNSDKIHTLEIRPLFSEKEPQELRLESICLAGGKATIIE